MGKAEIQLQLYPCLPGQQGNGWLFTLSRKLCVFQQGFAQIPLKNRAMKVCIFYISMLGYLAGKWFGKQSAKQ